MTCPKNSKLMVIFVVITLGGFFYSVYLAVANECLNCHTSPRKLIQITREIEKSRPVRESKSKGPG